eukprot:460662-Pyramimonas_sp.AAC.1
MGGVSRLCVDADGHVARFQLHGVLRRRRREQRHERRRAGPADHQARQGGHHLHALAENGDGVDGDLVGQARGELDPNLKQVHPQRQRHRVQDILE